MEENKPTVLVVEDEELLLQAITRKLELNHIKAIACRSGQEALDTLNGLDKVPDAIWLDYYLKDMNGLAFMYSLKQNARFANVPTIVVSNSASPDKVRNMLTLGVKKYYLKAENKLDDLVASINNFIQEKNKINNGKS